MSRKEIQEAYSSRIHVFYGINYSFWKVIMELYPMSLGVDVWNSILVDYNVPDISPTDVDGRKLYGTMIKPKMPLYLPLVNHNL